MDSLQFQTIFTTIFFTKVGLGVSGFFLFSITAFITLYWILSSYVNHFQPSQLPNFILERRKMIWIFIGASVFIGIIGSSIVQGIGWERLLKFLKDRKSTRLNSSHVAISYAVFCLKKKKITENI